MRNTKWNKTFLEGIAKNDMNVMEDYYGQMKSIFIKLFCDRFRCSEERALDFYIKSFSTFCFAIRHKQYSVDEDTDIAKQIFTIGEQQFIFDMGKSESQNLINERQQKALELVRLMDQWKLDTIHLDRVLEYMTAEERKIVHLYYKEKKRHKEVAETFEVNERTMRKKKIDTLKKMLLFHRSSDPRITS